MLTNFLEHTRCPEASVGPLLAQCRAASDVEFDVPGGHTEGSPIPRIRRAFSPAELLATLERLASADTERFRRLSDLDEAISVLRLEQYVDISISSMGQSGPKSLVRQCY